MPDITMCDSKTCSLRATCYRNPASGTKPSEYRQSWYFNKTTEGEDCESYWPKDNRDA